MIELWMGLQLKQFLIICFQSWKTYNAFNQDYKKIIVNLSTLQIQLVKNVVYKEQHKIEITS